MSASQYLKRLYFDSVEGLEGPVDTQYLKRVDVVEILTEEGEVWDPSKDPNE